MQTHFSQPARHLFHAWAYAISIALLTAGACWLALVPAAQALPTARLVVGQGIGGASIGQTSAQVKKALGPPLFAQTGEPTPGHIRATDWYYSIVPSASDAPFYSLEVILIHGRVGIITAMAGPYVTSAGIGVGSSLTQVQQAYPKAHCDEVSPQDPGSFVCVVKTRHNGRRVDTRFIDFQPTGGVYLVEVGFADLYSRSERI
jgi:hypothetical protein